MGFRIFTALLAVLFLILTPMSLLSVLHRSHYEPTEVQLGDDFEERIRGREAELGLRPGVEKTFDWRSADRVFTDFAIVQLHGFSASRREISPVGERLAAALGMNLFMSRLCGHGLGAAGMARVTAECLLEDAEEALAIGLRMGRRVVLLATSTGVPLALHLARRAPEKVAAIIAVSPNFRPAPIESLLLKGPVGRWIAENLVKEHRWQADSPDEEAFWTTAYPAVAVHEMMNLLSWTGGFDLSQFRTPLLLFYTDVDHVVAVDLIKENFALYGGPKRLVEVTGADHVLAGDIKSPERTAEVIAAAEDFLRQELHLKTAEASR